MQEDGADGSSSRGRRGVLATLGAGGLLLLIACALLFLLVGDSPFFSSKTYLWVAPSRGSTPPPPSPSGPGPRLRPQSTAGPPPGAACGVDYRSTVTGGPNATVLPVCTREQLERDAAAVYRAGDGGHVQFPDCRLRWFTPEEACDLLEKYDVVLAMAGDSLVRHVTQVLLSVMTGDFQRGGHMWWAQSKEQQAVCQCDAPFDDLATTCRFHSAAFDLSDQRRYCPQWSRRRVIFHEKTAPQLLAPSAGMTASNNLTELLTDPTIARPFVYLCFGIHLNFERAAGRDGYLEPLWALVRAVGAERQRPQQRRQRQQQQQQQRRRRRVGMGVKKAEGGEAEGAPGHPPHILLATFPYPGKRKDLLKYPRQGRDSVERWNAFLREYQAAHAEASTLIDYAPVSDHSWSGDGTHYLQDTNVIMAQFVLNHVAAQVGA